ncbi:hypothetical protein H6802_00560 [Candidatus Nomurabacteria bacterium]|uniref:Uncharacterized protein n=1 Tax=candidate division WWE3 bacterium TaxID=2053526 RepID=A0A955IW34_UNCKA|nr:hypothetical protein [candidate division WWE3 bacterium]MCB9823441.1 hypothetical protein [Candidatus Nomurabacteria bacterium]MCB9827723.1 hypothetical protein [Candidatus Nomurabacteria bacterium]HXK52669.1 hypothetical protein [bacterium]
MELNDQVIKRRLKIIDDLTTELRELKSQIDDSLENNPDLQELEEQMTQVREAVKEKKQKALETESHKRLQEEIRQKRQEITENKETLSQELADYYAQSGLMEIEDHEGNIKKMKFSVKLVS